MSEQLILASSSRYKISLFGRLGIKFTAVSADIDESPLVSELPIELVKRLSEQKALAIATLNIDSWVIGADQVGSVENMILEKPGNYEKAYQQLQFQSGKSVYFHCGVTLAKQSSNGTITKITEMSTTEVIFRQLSDTDIKAYLEKEQPYDCAGSFKSEGLGISLFDQIKSNDPTCLIGLPLILVRKMLCNQAITI
ncbi:MAG: Maf family protein [Porticoccaceae bacterium]